MIVPWKNLKSENVRALAEEFVLREGTDYGERELSLDAKVNSVLALLDRGEIEVVFDVESESCDLREAKKSKSVDP
jgi:uncharacterized protein YheU (UPF0270 family)